MAKIEDQKTGVQKTDRDTNLPQWSIDASRIDKFSAESDVLTGTVTAASAPDVSGLVTFKNLQATHYATTNADGGFHTGLAFRADGVQSTEQRGGEK